MIKCGAIRGHRHATVSEVRDCYAERDAQWAQVEDDHAAEVRLERRHESPAFYGVPERTAWTR